MDKEPVYVGKTIKSTKLGNDDAVHIQFTDGTGIRIVDNYQTCCEVRYMRTDDDLEQCIGKKLLDITVKDAPDIQDGDEEHEVQFLELQTTGGVFTFSCHNEHNGYYGGFGIVIKEELIKGDA